MTEIYKTLHYGRSKRFFTILGPHFPWHNKKSASRFTEGFRNKFVSCLKERCCFKAKKADDALIGYQFVPGASEACVPNVGPHVKYNKISLEYTAGKQLSQPVLDTENDFNFSNFFVG